jgi:uncharacterized SAM-binding protein YcdF (DUF218 family)
MLTFLTKLLTPFIYPLGAAILVGVLALGLSFTKCRRGARIVLAVALVALWGSSTPVLANWLNARLQSGVPQVDLGLLPKSDVVIVLGGSQGRVLHALRLYRAGKAPLIAISGGNPLGEGVSEAQQNAELLVELGAPHYHLILETASRTTRENAVNIAAIFKEHGWRSGLLVTSGAHMPRALAAFQKVGLNVTPAATELRSWTPITISPSNLIPSVEALAWTTSAIKEMLGLCFYRVRGWA